MAGAHHERLDGSGYHRGAAGAGVCASGAVLAAADAYHAMTEPRPHREPLPARRGTAEMVEEASAGRLDPDAVDGSAGGGRAAGAADRPRRRG